MSQKPKVVNSYQVDCPNRYTMGSPCPHNAPKGAVMVVYDDGTMEVVCLYCGLVKKLKES
ncbi:hypothetical protein ES708_29995 [subsurface metagenome]